MSDEKWFYEKPTKCGLYWYECKDGTYGICSFYGGNDYEYGFSKIGYDGPVGLKDFGEGVRFFGPLNKPE